MEPKRTQICNWLGEKTKKEYKEEGVAKKSF